MGARQKRNHAELTPEEFSDLEKFKEMSIEGASRQSDFFDKAILTVGALTFAGSIGWINYLHSVKVPVPRGWAVSTWVFMPLAIACVVATFFLSRLAGEWAARRVDEIVAVPALFTATAFHDNRAYKLSKALNVLSAILFLAGLVAFAGLLIAGLQGSSTL